MEKFTTLESVPAPMRAINIDTDQIIPAQFLRSVKKTGFGPMLFNSLRYQADGSENPQFVLNEPGYRTSRILVVGDNFGCGSSREHAPWALLDFGIRCVISTSFAEIFFNNSLKNGLLPVVVGAEALENLFGDAESGRAIKVDLLRQRIVRAKGEAIPFDMDASRKHLLVNGLDDIGLTLEHEADIGRFEAAQKASQPWLY